MLAITHGKRQPFPFDQTVGHLFADVYAALSLPDTFFLTD